MISPIHKRIKAGGPLIVLEKMFGSWSDASEVKNQMRKVFMIKAGHLTPISSKLHELPLVFRNQKPMPAGQTACFHPIHCCEDDGEGPRYGRITLSI